MKISTRHWYYITAIVFPLFFLLHGVNEQFGLIRSTIVAKLLIYYFIISIATAIGSKLLMKDYARAAVFTFYVLCVFFFFGAVKDFLEKNIANETIVSYKILLPLVSISVIIAFSILKRKNISIAKLQLFIRTLLIVFLLLEAGTLVYNAISHKERQKDLGDFDNQLAKNIKVSDTASKPFIFWVVLDEYSGSTALKRRWNYNNPLDSILTKRGFIWMDSARSPYNYTHYSLLSSLDMVYLDELRNHSVIGFRDIVRGNISLRKTNVTDVLQSIGYKVQNYTIYNIDDHATKAQEYFVDADFKLIDNQTLPGRVNQDIGWNFKNILSYNRIEKDSADHAKGIMNEAAYRQKLLEQGLGAVTAAVGDSKPSFFMFHFMFAHEPYLYNSDGSVNVNVGYGMYPDRYIYSIDYANRMLTGFIDSIKTLYSGRDYVIILQGDHGYKFDEDDTLFDQEGCSILYAVFCSDGNYKGWTGSFNAVNGFRVLFNKYFSTDLPILENRTDNLYYR